jgi:hypothetical protein
MVRPIFAMLFSCIFLTHLVAANVSKPQYVVYDRRSVRDPDTFVSLVQQSHDIDSTLLPPTRAWILTRQAEMISHIPLANPPRKLTSTCRTFLWTQTATTHSSC